MQRVPVQRVLPVPVPLPQQVQLERLERLAQPAGSSAQRPNHLPSCHRQSKPMKRDRLLGSDRR
ncbi:MAG: hypothetical protein ACI8UD_001805, partial [Planctomycetota bacterium]